MSKYLISKTEVYRADTENEAAALIASAKNSSDYTLTKYSRDYKEKKQKGEIVDSWYKVSLTKVYDDEKEPIGAPIYEESSYEAF
jgi:hypothetical protein